jgi:protein-tyrosine phosphatase
VELMPQVVQWPADPAVSSPNRFELIETCGRHLAAGELVVLPTESAYVAAANGLHADAVAKLAALRPESAPMVFVAAGSAEEARDWVPETAIVGRRLARRGWPGPLALVLADGGATRAASLLPDGVLLTIAPGGKLGLVAPHHGAVRSLMESLPFPLVLGELGESVTTADIATKVVGEAAAIVIDAGPTQFGRPATIVEVREEGWSVLREGTVTTAELNRLTATVVLFLCTGNTCRSPLAAALCRKQLADRLGCGADELPERGYLVASAGLAAVYGQPAAAEAVAVARELGADLTDHASRPATQDLLCGADVIVGMTAGHLMGLADYAGPDVRLRLLCGETDLPDPIGGDAVVYQGCAGAIWQHLPGLLDELLANPGQKTGVPETAT